MTELESPTDSKLPRLVSLPEVSEYTDNVVFGNLGLPVGFDDERLQVNLRAFRRVQRVAGLATVSVVSAAGERDQFDFNISGVDADGAATMRGAAKRHKQPLSTGNTQFPADTTMFDNPDVIIKVNTGEVEARTQTSEKYKKGLLDPKAQARFLDKAVRRGLTEASWHANVDKFKIGYGLRTYGMFAGLALLGGSDIERTVPFVLGAAPVLTNLGVVIAIHERYMRGTQTEGGLETWRRFRQTFFAGCAFDRFLGGAGLATNSKFIKSRS
ncbi:MAG TPA: hypothetical protein VG992_00835 [Candidatus Saccharimonadales bacterium]|nr:hypothetical protein [Candidatus Saccharimonadales bacterium]